VFFPAADTIAFSEGGAEAMRIDSSGNVGIGTTSPSKKLSIATGATNQVLIGTADSAGTYNAISLTGSTADASLVGLIGGGGSDTNLYLMAPDNLIFRTAGSNQRMQINSSGEFGMGMSTAATVRVSIASGTTFIMIGRDSTGATDQIRISGNGNVANTNNSYGSLSDIKLKENIIDATPKLDDLMKVQIRNYNLKGNYEQHKQIGVIAQELEQVFPAMIEETSDTDVEGNELGTTTKSVKYSVFVPMLIKAIQEQQTIINDIKAQLDNVKTELATLKGAVL
jgi:hypothetical protein